MGQLMVFRREALDAVGGLSCAEGHLVDDMRIGACLAAAGWRNIPSSHALRIVTGGMDLVSFLKLMRRWLFFQRGGLPHSFTDPLWLRGFEFGFGLAVGLGLLATGHSVAAVPPLAAMAAVAWSVAALHRSFGGAPIAARHLLVPFGLFLAGPLAHLAAILKPAVQWRGRDYALDARARLETPRGDAAMPEDPGPLLEPGAIARATRREGRGDESAA